MLAPTALIALITSYGYLLIFLLAIVEGPIVSILAGFVSSLGYLHILPAYAVVVASDIVGDALYYALGRWGGEPALRRWGHRIGITGERVAGFEARFARHRRKSLAIGKLTHAIGALVLVTAGIVRMPVGEFLLVNFLLSLPKSLLLVLVGYYFGRFYPAMGAYQSVVMAGLLALGLAALYVLFSRLAVHDESEP
jgi:membrane protein DedA with SNARE-associated domain